VSVRVADLSLIAGTMAALRADPPATLLGRPATAEDLLPGADVLRLHADGVRVVVRPSGTEPKLKAYLEVVTADRATAAAELDALRAELAPRLG
jgi:phosphomannomutase